MEILRTLKPDKFYIFLFKKNSNYGNRLNVFEIRPKKKKGKTFKNFFQ